MDKIIRAEDALAGGDGLRLLLADFCASTDGHEQLGSAAQRRCVVSSLRIKQRAERSDAMYLQTARGIDHASRRTSVAFFAEPGT